MNTLNAAFELVGSVLAWISVRHLYRDRLVTGVYAPQLLFSAAWSCSSPFYYWSHGDMASVMFSSVRALALLTWGLIWFATRRAP